MTDREKAIVMAHTGICMLEGEKMGVFYQYLEELYGHPVYTHELVSLDIKEKSKPDFLQLCKEEEPDPCEDAVNKIKNASFTGSDGLDYVETLVALNALAAISSSAQPESTRTFVELVVKYPDPELCTYKEYKGKPYYSIKYIENGETYIGYGTYNPEVLSQYLKEYFISSAQPDWDEMLVTCDCCGHAIHVKRIDVERREEGDE